MHNEDLDIFAPETTLTVSPKMTRFDLENRILECWNVTGDIDVVFEGMLDSDLSVDQTANMLLGIKELYELKFQKLWNTFEELIKKGDL
jgi:hypothetical protein